MSKRYWSECEEGPNVEWFVDYTGCEQCPDYEQCKAEAAILEAKKHEVQTKMECPNCHNTKTLYVCTDHTKVWCPECDFSFTVTIAVGEAALAKMKKYQVIVHATDGTSVLLETDDYEEARAKVFDWLGSNYDEAGKDCWISMYGDKIMIERRK